jgi:hypothetical protein
LSGLVGFLFILAQLIESDRYKTNNSYKALHSRGDDEDNEDKTNLEQDHRIYVKSKRNQIFKLSLFLFLCLFVSGYMTVLTRFMLTYLTLGPAKLSLEQFAHLQTLFWLLFIFSRFLVTFLAFKFSAGGNCLFFLFLLSFNFFINVLFLLPVFTKFSLFFWLSISLLGLMSGPLLPQIIVLAKQQIKPFKPFVLALFVASFAFGGIIFQQITGSLLDVLKTQKLTSDFCVKYILNTDFQILDEDQNITPEMVIKYQTHISLKNLIKEITYYNSDDDSVDDFETVSNRDK